MIEAEVIRLRRLRRAALLTRALARSLQSGRSTQGAFARSGVAAWGIARLANGKLWSHPNLSYQQGPGALQTLIDRALAAATAFVARKQGRPYGVFAQQLQILAREVDDVRALTWSADLSDVLGRAQWQLLRALQDLNAGIHREGGAPIAVRAAAPSAASANPTDWPYLAI
jgi:hypothetical protein